MLYLRARGGGGASAGARQARDQKGWPGNRGGAARLEGGRALRRGAHALEESLQRPEVKVQVVGVASGAQAENKSAPTCAARPATAGGSERGCGARPTTPAGRGCAGGAAAATRDTRAEAGSATNSRRRLAAPTHPRWCFVRSFSRAVYAVMTESTDRSRSCAPAPHRCASAPWAPTTRSLEGLEKAGAAARSPGGPPSRCAALRRRAAACKCRGRASGGPGRCAGRGSSGALKKRGDAPPAFGWRGPRRAGRA